MHLFRSNVCTSLRRCGHQPPRSRALSTPPPLVAGRPPYRVLLFTSGEFGLPALSAIAGAWKPAGTARKVISHLEVVCGADDTSHNRKAIAKVRAQELGVQTVHQIPPQIDIKMNGWDLPASTAAEFDIGVVVSFGYFIPPRIISRFRYGMINVHPSPLPKYRGASPIQSVLWADEPATAITIGAVHPTAFDKGVLFDQLSVPIAPLSTYQSLMPQLSSFAAERVLHALTNFPALIAAAKPQSELPPAAKGTPVPATAPAVLSTILSRYRAPLFKKTDAHLQFTVCSADEIWRQYAAMHGMQGAIAVTAVVAGLSHASPLTAGEYVTGYFPLYTSFRGERLLILEMLHPAQAKPTTANTSLAAGEMEYDATNEVLWVACGPGGGSAAIPRASNAAAPHTPAIGASNRIGVKRLQIATKRAMTAAAFANGYLLKPATASAAAARKTPPRECRFT